jgi:hypothetical protein
MTIGKIYTGKQLGLSRWPITLARWQRRRALARAVLAFVLPWRRGREGR